MSGDIGKYMGDLYTCWWLFLVMLGISTVISMIYLFLLRCIAKPLLYISFVLILVLVIAGGIYVFTYASNNYEDGDDTKLYMQICAYVLWGLAVVYFIILMCCCSRIRLAIAIQEAASDFVRNTMSIFTVPFIFFFIILIWIIFWVISAVYVYSVGDLVKDDTLPIANIEWNTTTRYVWIYHLFGLFWISAFIIGCSQFIIAATAAIWYFSVGADSDSKAKGSFLTAYKWIFRYHMGSIAFGALIIAIMQMIKLMFEYFRRKFEKSVP